MLRWPLPARKTPPFTPPLDPAHPAAYDFVDFPTAWAIQNEVGPRLQHHPRCSSVPGWDPLSGPGFLCDCGAVERHWEWLRNTSPCAA